MKTKIPDHTAGPERQSVDLSIDEIILDESVSVRATGLDLDKIEEYAANFDNLPAVWVFVVDGKYTLVDGWHRIHAAARLKRKTISTIVVGTGSIDDARDAGDCANLKHGLCLTRSQKQEIARRLHTRHPKWSNREIAKRMGVTHPTVAHWLEPEETGKNLPPSSEGAPSTPQGSTPEDEVTPPESPVETPVRETTKPKVITGDAKPQTSKQNDAEPASTVDQSLVVDAEFIVFAEKSFIEVSEIDAKRSGQPLSETAHQKLTGLRDLISGILGTKAAAQ
jgi:hypothetical protein